MNKLAGVGIALLLGGCMATAQNSSSGTVNSMSNDPEQNQKATGAMGTTTGQPNDVTPGSANSPNGGVPTTRTMTGSDSNGKMNQQGGSTSTATTQANSKSHKKSKVKPNSSPSSGSSASQTDMGATKPGAMENGSASPNAGSPPPHM